MEVNLKYILIIAVIIGGCAVKMNNPELITVIMGILLLFLLLFMTMGTKEAFESYESCIDQGYPQNFCLHVPAQSTEQDDLAYDNDVSMPTKLNNPVPPANPPIRHWCRPGDWCKPKWIKNIYDRR